MSWSIYVSCFLDGQVGRFRRQILERAFEGFTDRSFPDAWKIDDEYDHGGTVYIEDGPEIRGFSVNRPPGPDHPFWPAIINVLKQTNCVLYWPGKGCVVADKSVIAHISADFDETMGTPTVTTDIDKIMEMIRKA